MTRSGSPRTPQHESGDFGERFVAYMLPAAWVVHSYKGSEDYGIDFHVEIFSTGRATGLEFGIQVKTVERLSSRPRLTLTQNNLSYLMAKPYPCMIVAVSRTERCARFSWLMEIFSYRQLIKHLREARRQLVHAPLQPSYDFENASQAIAKHLQTVRDCQVSWFLEETHRRFITELYFDLHSSLDALVECISIIHGKDHGEDEVSHKGTFTITLTLMAYNLIHYLTRDCRIESLGPAAPMALAILRQMRTIIAEFVPEEFIEPTIERPPDDAPVAIVPGSLTRFWPTAPRLTRLLRDALRSLGKMMAPWRNFDLYMSGLATNVIEYPHRITPSPEN